MLTTSGVILTRRKSRVDTLLLNRVFDGEVVHQFEDLGLGKHFSELEIDQFVEAWLSRYPDALERERSLIKVPNMTAS
jgi:hypothetical protein